MRRARSGETYREDEIEGRSEGKSLSRHPQKVFPLDPYITGDNPCKKYREIVRSNLRLQPINPVHPEEGKAVETGSKITPCLAVFSGRPHIRKRKKEGFPWSRNNTSDAPLLSFALRLIRAPSPFYPTSPPSRQSFFLLTVVQQLPPLSPLVLFLHFPLDPLEMELLFKGANQL